MVQIAEQVTDPKTIEVTLSYFVDTDAMPVTLVGAPGGSDQRVGGGASEPRRVVLRNGRIDAGDFVLERNGFRFVRHDTKVADFFDEDEVRRVYYPEMQALVKAESGASRVEVFDHTLRTADDELRETRKIREVVRFTTTTPNGRARSECAPFCRTKPTSCSAAASPSSRCGGRSVVQSSHGLWRSPMRRVSRLRAWWLPNAAIPTASARPTPSPTTLHTVGIGSRGCGPTRRWSSRPTSR